MEEEIVMFRNPFITKSIWYEFPLTSIGDNWIKDEFGFDVCRSANKYINWLYFEIPKHGLFQLTPECMQDRKVVREFINHILEKNK